MYNFVDYTLSALERMDGRGAENQIALFFAPSGRIGAYAHVTHTSAHAYDAPESRAEIIVARNGRRGA